MKTKYLAIGSVAFLFWYLGKGVKSEKANGSISKKAEVISNNEEVISNEEIISNIASSELPKTESQPQTAESEPTKASSEPPKIISTNSVGVVSTKIEVEKEPVDGVFTANIEKKPKLELFSLENMKFDPSLIKGEKATSEPVETLPSAREMISTVGVQTLERVDNTDKIVNAIEELKKVLSAQKCCSSENQPQTTESVGKSESELPKAENQPPKAESDSQNADDYPEGYIIIDNDKLLGDIYYLIRKYNESFPDGVSEKLKDYAEVRTKLMALGNYYGENSFDELGEVNKFLRWVEIKIADLENVIGNVEDGGLEENRILNFYKDVSNFLEDFKQDSGAFDNWIPNESLLNNKEEESISNKEEVISNNASSEPPKAESELPKAESQPPKAESQPIEIIRNSGFKKPGRLDGLEDFNEDLL